MQFAFLVSGLDVVIRARMGEQVPALADEKAWREIRSAVPKLRVPSPALEEDLVRDCQEKGLIGPRR